jgi:Uma2 family endonuclease
MLPITAEAESPGSSAMAIQSRALNYDDLERLRETRDEQLELIDGELFVTPSPTRLHQLVSKRLNRIFMQAVDDTGIGEYYDAPFDVRLADDSIVQPDLLVVLREHFAKFTDDWVGGSPDLVVEIVSPSTGRRDLVIKRDLYARHSVPEYWLVDPPARTVTVYADPHQGQYRNERTVNDMVESVIVPGLAVDLAELFSP